MNYPTLKDGTRDWCMTCQHYEEDIEGENCWRCEFGYDPNDTPSHYKEAITNADRIRFMTDEELARFLCDISACDYCPVFKECVYTDNNDRSLLEWLRSEADG